MATIPPFSQYQAPLVPMHGNWNRRPKEGDYFVNATIEWSSQAEDAVQFNLGGNSPVALSQIAALYVDNRRSGVDIDFVFPDSGFLLTVPARAQGLYPVITNALMFYAIATGADFDDSVVFQILNSLMPPIALLPTQQNSFAAISGVDASVNATTNMIPPGTTGTLNTISASIVLVGPGSCTVLLADGNANNLWAATFTAPAGATLNIPINLPGLSVRFVDGLSLSITGSTVAAGSVVGMNLYFSTP